MKACYELKIQSILIEGGKKLLQSFIDKNIWDEALIITNTKMFIGKGLAAPELTDVQLQEQFFLGDDLISAYKKL